LAHGYGFLLDGAPGVSCEWSYPVPDFGATFPAALIECRLKRTPVDASASMLFERAYVVTIANTSPPSE
jgi:hypothetical protein